VVQCRLCKCKPLSSNSSSTHTQKQLGQSVHTGLSPSPSQLGLDTVAAHGFRASFSRHPIASEVLPLPLGQGTWKRLVKKHCLRRWCECDCHLLIGVCVCVCVCARAHAL
jgi:hypothetical protein